MSRWMDLAPPVAVLAVPFDGEDDPDLDADLPRVLVLDRWRLLACLIEADVDETELAPFEAWTTTILASLQV